MTLRLLVVLAVARALVPHALVHLRRKEEGCSDLASADGLGASYTLVALTSVLTTFFTAAVLAAYDAVWKNLADLVLFNQS